MTPDVIRFRGGRRLTRAALAAALIGAASLALGAFLDPRRLFFSYLAAYAFAVSIAIGGLIFLMICHAMRATWPVAIRRLLETMVSPLPVLAVLFVPLLLGLDALYPWLRPDSIRNEEALHLIRHKAPYLNLPFFLARTAGYFVVWIAVAALLRRWSLRNEVRPARALSAGALPLVALTLSFAAFDWLMSLEPTWVSTMFPIYVFAGGFVAAIAALTVITFAAQRAGLLPWITESHYHALGRLLLAFTIFWAYAAYFQFMLMWLANVPLEAEFYVRRLRGPWEPVSVLLVIVRFVVPFFALLSYRVKRRPRALAAVAGWIIAGHYIDVHWLVLPQAAPPGVPYHWLDFGALLAVAGVSIAFATWSLRGRPIAPINDPALPEAMRYESQ